MFFIDLFFKFINVFFDIISLRSFNGSALKLQQSYLIFQLHMIMISTVLRVGRDVHLMIHFAIVFLVNYLKINVISDLESQKFH